MGFMESPNLEQPGDFLGVFPLMPSEEYLSPTLRTVSAEGVVVSAADSILAATIHPSGMVSLPIIEGQVLEDL